MYRNVARRLEMWCRLTKGPTAMIQHIDRFQKLKRQAMQLMLTGQVDQYMKALRIMSRIAVR
jgi:hypothetical protein